MRDLGATCGLVYLLFNISIAPGGPIFFHWNQISDLGGVATGIPTHGNFGSTDCGFHRARCVFHLGSGQNFIVGIEAQFGLLLVGKCPYMYKMGPAHGPAVWSWAQ